MRPLLFFDGIERCEEGFLFLSESLARLVDIGSHGIWAQVVAARDAHVVWAYLLGHDGVWVWIVDAPSPGRGMAPGTSYTKRSMGWGLLFFVPESLEKTLQLRQQFTCA